MLNRKVKKIVPLIGIIIPFGIVNGTERWPQCSQHGPMPYAAVEIVNSCISKTFPEWASDTYISNDVQNLESPVKFMTSKEYYSAGYDSDKSMLPIAAIPVASGESTFYSQIVKLKSNDASLDANTDPDSIYYAGRSALSSVYAPAVAVSEITDVEMPKKITSQFVEIDPTGSMPDAVVGNMALEALEKGSHDFLTMWSTDGSVHVESLGRDSSDFEVVWQSSLIPNNVVVATSMMTNDEQDQLQAWLTSENSEFRDCMNANLPWQINRIDTMTGEQMKYGSTVFKKAQDSGWLNQ